MIRQVFRFGVVGITAMAVHLLTVMGLVQLTLHPLVANVFAFLMAFHVSYLGHRQWTFAAYDVPHRQAWRRFLAVAGLGFISNEGLYFLLLQFTPLDYVTALIIVLFLVAAMTFVLSRQWAFR